MSDQDPDEIARLEALAAEHIAQLLGVQSVDELRGAELPGLGVMCGVTMMFEAGGLVVWFNDDTGSTRVVPLKEAVHAMRAERRSEGRRASTRASASRSESGELHVETSAEVDGLMMASSESHAVSGDASVSSRSDARPIFGRKAEEE